MPGTITIGDLEGRDFADVAETAQIMRCDARTIRRRCQEGVIPAIKVADWRIPTAWLRQQAGVSA